MFFFFKQKTAYKMLRSLVGSQMCIRVRFPDQGLFAVCQPGNISASYGLDLFPAHPGLLFAAQTAVLTLFFQKNLGQISVVVPDPKFFPAVYSIQLFLKALSARLSKYKLRIW